MNEARRVLGLTSKTDVVIIALKELIRRHRVEHLKDLFGHVRLDIDVPRSRRRPARRA